METIAVQLNHPGIEKKHTYRNKFVEGKGYYKIGNQLIREWNNDDSHYRKCLRQTGTYVERIKTTETKNDTLIFWGEWEGYSKFHPLTSASANGIHEPFHSIIGSGSQNTDPYVFGSSFKYAICSQKGIMTKLDVDSLILFGTSTDKGFLLDTVFVVEDWESAESVNRNNAMNYTQIYREETLEMLGEIYLGQNPSLRNRIYMSKTWRNDKNKDFFSYVPCKLNNQGTDKVVLPFEIKEEKLMIKQKVGHPYKHFTDYSTKQLWGIVTKLVLEQGFYLGIKFDEPVSNNILAKKNGSNTKKSKCSTRKWY